MISLSLGRGLPSDLGVTKRHRPDKSLSSHARRLLRRLGLQDHQPERARLSHLLQEFGRIVPEAAGRFYFAKNSQTLPQTTAPFLGPRAIAEFRRLKKRRDATGVLESDLYRRVFAREASRRFQATGPKVFPSHDRPKQLEAEAPRP